MSPGPRILLLDSDYEFFEGIERLLRAWFGFDLDLIYLRDPAELEMARSARPPGSGGILDGLDLVIAETAFPGEERGPREMFHYYDEVFKEREVPVMILGEGLDRRLGLDALRAGLLDTLEKKDLHLPTLEARVHRALNLSRRIREHREMSAELHSMRAERSAADQEMAELNATVERMRGELEQEYETKLTLEKDKNRMQSVFGMYVDPKIVEGILNDEITVDQKGRRESVTVMFADLRGYTSMTEDMDPEKVISFLNEFFTSMTEVIMGYEGMVDKYIGDGIMCLFGTPIEDPEHRDKALLTAMEMFSIFELWQTNWESNYGIRPAMGIGLASGDVVVGNVGSFQKISYTAVGDTVNLAARLESMAKPGEVLISSDLFENLTEASRDKYIFEPLDPIDIRGKRGKHQVYRLVREFAADDILQFG
ncbi:MAG: adenylate/guanylate cyclase domain-containing protein [bacterium]|nr:adenylate/guanylate cyclase domain-containing protein [bacterium]